MKTFNMSTFIDPGNRGAGHPRQSESPSRGYRRNTPPGGPDTVETPKSTVAHRSARIGRQICNDSSDRRQPLRLVSFF